MLITYNRNAFTAYLAYSSPGEDFWIKNVWDWSDENYIIFALKDVDERWGAQTELCDDAMEMLDI